MTLKAKKFSNDDKFKVAGGYTILTGYGVANNNGEWVSFDGEMPFNPQGGRKAAKEVADTCNPAELSYVASL